ncbi:MAG: hypothetical protein KOO63_08260 [Bacteroidales bacterium]|nr:hypothetical protein [Candidatus Latescibacterota bacterium]
MATYIPLSNHQIQYVDSNGDPLVNGTLEFYLAGTTTATSLFSDVDGTSVGVSVTLNSLGMPESGGNVIFLFRDQSKAIKIVGKNATGATLWTDDNIPAVASFDSTASTKLDTVEENADVTDATNVAAAGALMTDGSASMSGDLEMGAGTFVLKSVTAGITASVTQTQGEQVLISRINEVSTVANANDVVTMPSAVGGISATVINNGANVLGIFPASGDDNGSGVDTVTTLASGSNVTFAAYDDTTWEAI